MNKDVRWKQRFQNFEKAFLKLKEAVDMEELSELEENGLIQRFEFTIELCWNILKDFMEEEGVQIKLVYPKEIIREAGKVNLLDDPQTLINALTLRNELSHDYDGVLLEEAITDIRNNYYFSIEKVYLFFKDKIKNS